MSTVCEMESSKQENIMLKNKECLQVEIFKDNSSPQKSDNPGSVSTLENEIGAPTAETSTQNSLVETEEEEVLLWTIPEFIIALCHGDDPEYQDEPDTELTPADSHVAGGNDSEKVESLVTESSPNDKVNALCKEKVDDDHYETNINVQALNQDVKTTSTSTESTKSEIGDDYVGKRQQDAEYLMVKKETESCEVSTNNSGPQTSGEASGSQTAIENSVVEVDKEKVVLPTIPKIVITLCHDDKPAIREQPDTELTTADSHGVGEKESVNVQSLDNNCLVPLSQRSSFNDQNTLTDSRLPNGEKIIQDSAGAEVVKEKQDAKEGNLTSLSKTDAIIPKQGQNKTESSPKDNVREQWKEKLDDDHYETNINVQALNQDVKTPSTSTESTKSEIGDDYVGKRQQDMESLTVKKETESCEVSTNNFGPQTSDEASSTPTLLKEIQGAPIAQTAIENSVAEADKEKVVLWTIPKIVITPCHDDEPAIREQPNTELTTADRHVVREKESVKVHPLVTSVEKVSPDTVGLEDIQNQGKPSSLAKTSAINPTHGKGEIETSSKADTDVKLKKMKDEDHHQSSINVQALNQHVKTLSAFEKSPEDHRDVGKRNAIEHIPTSPRQVAEKLVKKNNESYQPAEADHNNYLAAPIEIDDIELFDKLSTGGSEISADEINIVGECLYTAVYIESWNDACLVPSCQLTCSDEQNTSDACISKAEVHSNQVLSAGSPPVLEEPRSGYGDIKSVLPLEQALADSHLPVPSVEKVTSDSVGAQMVIEKKKFEDNEITSDEDKPTGSATICALISTEEQEKSESSLKVIDDQIRKEKINDDDHYLTNRNIEALYKEVKTPSTSGGSPKDQIVDNSDEVNVTSSNISKMKKNEKAKDKTTKEKVKKNKTTKADKKKVKKAKAEKKNAEKDEVSRPKSKKFCHRFFNIFCCCCGKSQESKDL